MVLSSGDRTHLEKVGVSSAGDVCATNQSMKRSEVLVKSVLATLESASMFD